MTREEQKARDAKKYYPNDINCYYAFLHGAEWADKHPNLERLWHDASEVPQDKNKHILCYSEYFDYLFIEFPNYLIVKYGGQNKDWGAVVLRNKISKWAYIDDLLPKGGNE